MKQILNFGSLNIDHVYSVEHIVSPGETIGSLGLAVYPGGKGLNQSIALARAGAQVAHVGMVGDDGAFLVDLLKESGVDCGYIRRQSELPSGHAIIQVDRSGQNAILLHEGANHAFTTEYIDHVLAENNSKSLILLQNEINLVVYIIESAKKCGHDVALNPSPFDRNLMDCDFGHVDILLLNEIEGRELSGADEADAILDYLKNKYPQMSVVLTLGGDGSALLKDGVIYRQDIHEMPVADTTAAGDSFTGYFLAGLLAGLTPARILRQAAVAAGLAVSRKGAASSIPWALEVGAVLGG